MMCPYQLLVMDVAHQTNLSGVSKRPWPHLSGCGPWRRASQVGDSGYAPSSQFMGLFYTPLRFYGLLGSKFCPSSSWHGSFCSDLISVVSFADSFLCSFTSCFSDGSFPTRLMLYFINDTSFCVLVCSSAGESECCLGFLCGSLYEFFFLPSFCS